MSLRRPLLLLLPALLLGQEPAPAPLRPATFVAPSAFQVERLLPDPPAPGSLAAQADLLAVKQTQALRTPELAAWAKTIDTGTIWQNAAVLGSGFTAEALPICAAFFAQVREDVWQASQLTKKRFNRPRPPKVDPTIQPCVPVPNSGSYPSGHSLQIYSWVGLLSELFPEQREALGAYADRMVWGRIIAGVHYPSDLVGARMMAEQLLKAYRETAAWKQGIEACRKELAAAGLRKAS